jgi:hypothetical protein
VSAHDPKATFRTKSRVQNLNAERHRRSDRQGGLLASAVDAGVPLVPNGFGAARDKLARNRPHPRYRAKPSLIAQQLGRHSHQYQPPLFSTGADAYTFTGTDGDSWNPLWTFTQGTGDILTNRGRMVTSTTNFDGRTAWIDTAQSNGTVQIDVEIPTSDAQFPEVRFRFDTGNFDYVRVLLEPHNDIAYLHPYDNDVQQTVLDSEAFTVSGGDTVHIKMVGSGNEVRVRLWLNADSEPTTYQLIGSTALGASNTQLMVRTVTSDLGVAVTNYWDNLVITGAGIDTVTGTIARTDANDTSAITGTESMSGTIAVTDANDTSAFTGTLSMSGTIAVTDANDTSAITATESIPGTIAVTDANDTSAISGDHVAGAGSISLTDADDVSAFTGAVSTPSMTGTIGVTDANDTSSITASQAIPGTITVSEQRDTSAITGTVVYNPVGTSATIDANDTATLTGSTFPNPTGTFALTDAADAASLTGIVANPVTGSITITEQPDRTSISAQRFGRQPVEVREAGPVFPAGRRRRYYNPSRNPVTGPG